MFKTNKTYTVSVETVMSQIFPEGLPVNSFIHKGRCAIRATSLELESKSRITLLIVPNVSIILNKWTSKRIQDRPDYIVYGDISYDEIKKIFHDDRKGLKIMSTPEGMKRIMKAAGEAGKVEEVYRDWFLLLDESHTFISELYRVNILIPFNYFWKFDNKSILSATPYRFSDPRFNELHYHEVKFTDVIGTVTLVNAVSVYGTLNHLLINAHLFPGNIHIFYNSVTEIKRAILQAGLEDCNIFCADDKEKLNMAKLGELKKFFLAEPKEGLYKKINFYTCKYFEGWDLHDKDATLVLVTDHHKEHTKVGVSTKGKQAFGRLRSEPSQLIHITNHKHEASMIPLKDFAEEYTKDAKLLIANNNHQIANSKFDKFTGDVRVKKFADVDSCKIATLNLYKLDQQINESASNEIYNNFKFIKDDWEKAYFKVEIEYSDIKLDSKSKEERKSASTKLKEDYEELLKIRQSKPSYGTFTFGKTREQVIKEQNPLAYQAADLLNEATMKALKYNVKKVKIENAMRSNTNAEVKLLTLCRGAFELHNFYTNQQITSKLNEFYKKLGIIDHKTGFILKANPSDLGKQGRFMIRPGKRTIKGKRVSGYWIDAYSLGVKTLD